MILQEVNGMLLSFRVKNYRSFAEEVGIDLRASAIKEHADTVITHGIVSALPVLSVYGANASGKSNLFKAMQAMQKRVKGVLSDSPTMDSQVATYIVPYMFDEDASTAPTTFEIEVRIENDEFRYGFACTKTRVVSEWLFSKCIGKTRLAKEKCLFYRENEELETPDIPKTYVEKINYCFSNIGKNDLLLTELKTSSIALFKELHLQIANYIFVIDCSDNAVDRVLTAVIGEHLNDEELRQKAEHLLQIVDPAIKGITVCVSKDSDMNDVYTVYTDHEMADHTIFSVNLENESSGTKKFLSIITWVILCLGSGTMLFIDELDIKLHPLLLRHIIELFTNRETNPLGAQLVFSSHNLICLDCSDLRRDEIWFVEKNGQKSELYSLADVKSNNTSIRSDLDFGKHYLSGRFGAIPFQNDGGE